MIFKTRTFSVSLIVELFLFCAISSIVGVFLLSYHYESKIRATTKRWGVYTECSQRFSILTILAKDYQEHPRDRTLTQWDLSVETFKEYLDDMLVGNEKEQFVRSINFLDPTFHSLVDELQKESAGTLLEHSFKVRKLSAHITLELQEDLLLSDRYVKNVHTELLNLQHESRRNQNITFIFFIGALVFFPALFMLIVAKTFSQLTRSFQYISENPGTPLVNVMSVERVSGVKISELERLRLALSKMSESIVSLIAKYDKSQETLVNEFKRFTTVIDAMDALVYVADMHSHEMIFANKKCRDLTGDYKGKKCWEIMQEGQVGPCSFCTNSELLDGEGRPLGPYVWEFQNSKNGQWYECRDEAIEWVDGRIVRLETANNITLRKQAEKEKEQLEEVLRQTTKLQAVGTLAGGVAHDFNNILAAILGYSELVRIGLPDESEFIKDLDQIILATERATHLVRQILTFSKKTSFKRQEIAPGPIIHEALSMLSASLPKTINIEHHIDLDCGLVFGDPTSIHQVVMNLCTNAVKAMSDEKGTLKIQLGKCLPVDVPTLGRDNRAKQYVVLTVQDDGCGMTEETVGRIYEPYFSTRQSQDGTGLGLAVTRSIVEEHKGVIHVVSTLGKGSVFKVFIPARQKGKNVVDDITLVGKVSDVPGCAHVFVLDDEPSITKVMSRQLKRLGYKVTTETDSSKALELLTEGVLKIDILITDQTMPGITGGDLVQQLKEKRPELPVIMMTGHSEMVSEEEATSIGVDRFLRKPVSKDVISRVVKELL